jgi:hypothetical protein
MEADMNPPDETRVQAEGRKAEVYLCGRPADSRPPRIRTFIEAGLRARE